ncbi:hypothetical protein BCR34DRAFT_164621 [Clohesyomyces aquaticus]|uniref:Gelsolin-like domain-containing protein n=1 Tax=Clohesyomyces aquaticus TaxID=1231657 RepID=A0A1Y1YIQ5_9PLEO|nr:hypothetical protein BCR34DRAFT_164621 [Clohesyomyces aquaticus]
MPPHQGLVHQTEYDWRDSNVQLINSEIDHKVKYKSATTEPAWNNGLIGASPGLYIFRIEHFEVIPWPESKYGEFHEGDSYIILHSENVGEREGGGEKEHLIHDVYFWLGKYTTQDEAGTAAYKTVELDDFLHGAATQHRELQNSPSEDFLALFPRLRILRGGVESGFTHMEEAQEKEEEVNTLLRIFKHPGARDGVIVVEVEPVWQNLDENDVFVLDRGDKAWVWQGSKCAPMEKMKAAQVVNDLTIAKHVDVEVLAQSEARSKVFVGYLGGEDVDVLGTRFSAERPVRGVVEGRDDVKKEKKLFRISDAQGELAFDLVKDGASIGENDLDGNDVFLLHSGPVVWVWEGKGASSRERAMWLQIAQNYVQRMQDRSPISIAKAVEGHESRAFWTAVRA